MRKGILLLSLLVSVLHTEAQLIPVVRYYDSLNRKGIRESYQVLAQDTSVKQGLYRKYNSIGMVTEEVYFENGTESGKKIARHPATGLLRNIVLAQENGDYENYIFQFKNDGTNGYSGLIYEAKLDGQHANELQIKSVDSRLNELDGAILKKGGGKIPMFANVLSANGYNLNLIGMRNDPIDSLLKMGGYLLFRYFSILENMDELRANDSMIRGFAGRIEQVYRTGIPEVYEGSLKYYADSIQNYFMRDSIDDRYWRGFELMSVINRLQPFCDSILILDSLIENRRQLLSEYYSGKPHYAVLYGKSIEPVLATITGPYKAEESVEQRLSIGARILRTSQAFLEVYPELEKQRQAVDTESSAILKRYEQQYPGKFKQELAELRQYQMDYPQQESPDAMLREGEKLLKLVEELNGQYNKIQSSDARIAENFEADKAWYQQHEEKLYQNDFRIFEEKYLKYREMEVISEKLASAESVLKESRFFHESIDSLKRYQYAIDSIYPRICELYRKDYRDIFQEEIKPMKLGLADYSLKTSVTEKRKKGRELTEYIRHYQASYSVLEEKKMEITALIKSSSDSYKGYFPAVVRQEISAIRKRFDVWENCGKLSEKLQTGQVLRDDILNTDKRYDSIASQALQFRTLTLWLRDSLKQHFPDVFAHEHQPLIDQYNKLDEVGQSLDLAAKTQTLRDKGIELQRNYQEIRELKRKIQKENDLFNARIPNDREWSVILKRSRFHYYYFDRQILHSESCAECKKMQEELLNTLTRMNTLDHSQLLPKRKEFRKTRKPQDIRKLFLS